MTTTTVPVPTLGRVVLYRTDGRNGLAYDLPAVVQCTWETHPGDYPCGHCGGDARVSTGPEPWERQTCPDCDGTGPPNPLPVPHSPAHVHLTVLTPGGVGTKVTPAEDQELVGDDTDYVGAMSFAPGSGTYVELNVPHAAVLEAQQGEDLDPPHRSWRWPDRDTRTMRLTPAEDVWDVQLEVVR